MENKNIIQYNKINSLGQKHQKLIDKIEHVKYNFNSLLSELINEAKEILGENRAEKE